MSARTPEEVERGFPRMTREQAGAVIVAPDTLFIGQRSIIASLTVKHRIPSIFSFPEDAPAGGPASYGADQLDVYRRAATHVDKILKGAGPGELPIEQPTKVRLTINRKTAKALGITILQEMLLRADEPIG
jgi:putative ABC transport system substrate-binding protein